MAEHIEMDGAERDVLDALNAEVDRSLTFLSGLRTTAGYVPIVSTEDVSLGGLVGGYGGIARWGGEVLPAGVYFIRFKTGDRGRQNPNVYAMADMSKFGENEIKFVPVESEDGQAVTLNDFIAWSAYSKAMRNGDTDLADRIVWTVYGRPGRNDYPRQDAGRPVNHIQGISKVTDTMTELVADGKPYLLNMGGGATTRIALDYDAPDVSINKPITPMDMEIHNSVVSLYAEGKTYITPRQIFQTMAATTSKPRSSKEADIARSVEKQMTALVTLDFSEELHGRTAEFDGESVTIDQCKVKRNMLYAEEVEMIAANGAVVRGFHVKEPPVLYWHDKITKQLITYPQHLLEVTARSDAKSGKKGAPQNTDTNILLRSYMIKRIKIMSRNAGRQSRRIRLDSLYKAIGLGSLSGTQRARIFENACYYLNRWTDEGLISGYKPYRQGRSHKIIGFEIEIATNSKRG